MIKNSDFYTNFLIYGKPGSGKTTFACGVLDGLSKEFKQIYFPVALLDIDNKAQSQINIKKFVDCGDIDIFSISEALLGGGDLDYIEQKLDDDDIKTPLVIPKGYKRIVYKIADIVGSTTKKEYATLVIDSGSRLVQHLITLIMTINKKKCMTRNLWTTFGIEMTNRLSRILALPMNIIWIFHEGLDIDEVSGTTMVHPSIPGQTGEIIASYFNEVYHCRVDTIAGKPKYTILTCNDNRYVARTSGNLKHLEVQNMNNIFNKLQTFEVVSTVPTLKASKSGIKIKNIIK